MRFIRKGGRIIPIRESDEIEKHKSNLKKAAVGAAVSGTVAEVVAESSALSMVQNKLGAKRMKSFKRVGIGAGIISFGFAAGALYNLHKILKLRKKKGNT